MPVLLSFDDVCAAILFGPAVDCNRSRSYHHTGATTRK
jgi:hypothetical protein